MQKYAKIWHAYKVSFERNFNSHSISLLVSTKIWNFSKRKKKVNRQIFDKLIKILKNKQIFTHLRTFHENLSIFQTHNSRKFVELHKFTQSRYIDFSKQNFPRSTIDNHGEKIHLIDLSWRFWERRTGMWSVRWKVSHGASDSHARDGLIGAINRPTTRNDSD